MIEWNAARVAAAAGATLLRAPAGSRRGERSGRGPLRVVIDSREVRGGDLFIGLSGARADGGAYAAEALQKGAWGVLVAPAHARRALGAALPPGSRAANRSNSRDASALGSAVLAHPQPLQALQRLAAGWRAELPSKVVAITGSTGKTSTKDILTALLSGASRASGQAAPDGNLDGPRAGLRTSASPENFNTEIGLPLAVLGASRDTQVLVLEMGMRGPGQIAELTAIASPDVGLIVNVGPVHLQQLGSQRAVAAAKGELIQGLVAGAVAVLPTDEPLLAPYRREDLRTVTFGRGGDVELTRMGADGEVLIRAEERSLALRPSFAQAYNLRNLLAAVAVAHVLGVEPHGRVDVSFSALRGEHLQLPGGVLLINDCYNANPMSMRAALDDLAETATGRRVAVLGDMLELGARERSLHRELGAYAGERGVELLVTVGPRASAMRESFAERAGVEAHSVPDAAAAAALLRRLLRDGDSVLVKGSRGMLLERVADALKAPAGPAPSALPGNS
jgi:UDP-N-acetylmuramoyl-tripeptide--D-alanyl-D-alanine ligase